MYTFDDNKHTVKIEGLPNGTRVGVIAQEIEKVLPQLVSENKDGIKKVDYSSLAGFLIQVNKEQQVQLEKQQYEINEMYALLKMERTSRNMMFVILLSLIFLLFGLLYCNQKKS